MDEVRSTLQCAADAACPPITVEELERAPRRSRLPRRGYLAAAAAAAVVVSGGVVWAQLGESSSGDVIAGPPRERADALGARIPGDRAEGGDPRVSFEPLPLGECGLAGRSGAASTAATDPEVCRVAQAAFDEGGASTEPMRFIGRTVVAGELHTAAARGGMGEVFGARSPDERITIHLVRAEEPVFSGKDALLVGSPGPSGSGELRRLALSSESAAFAELEGLILAR